MLRRPLTADEKGGDVTHNEPQAVQNRPADNDAFEPGSAFTDRPIVFAEVHEQQGDGSGDNPGNGGDAEDLAVNVLHNGFGLLPYGWCGGSGACRQTEHDRYAEQKRGRDQPFLSSSTAGRPLRWLIGGLFQSDNLPG